MARRAAIEETRQTETALKKREFKTGRPFEHSKYALRFVSIRVFYLTLASLTPPPPLSTRISNVDVFD